MASNERTPKRQKLSPVEGSSSPDVPASTPVASTATAKKEVDNKRKSWYSGTWPRKSTPITQVARESISSASNTAIETAAVLKDKITPASTPARKSSLALTLGKKTSNKALPVEARATMDHATSAAKQKDKEQQQPQDPFQKPAESTAAPDNTITSIDAAVAADKVAAEGRDQTAEQKTEVAEDKSQKSQRSSTAAAPRSWIGWLAGGDGVSTKASQSSTEQPAIQPENVNPSSKDIDSKGAARPTSADRQADPDKPTGEMLAPEPVEIQRESLQRRSWLPLWNNATAAQSAPAISSPSEAVANPPRPDPASEVANIVQQPANKAEVKTSEPVAETSTQAPGPAKPSAWVFWSRDKGSETQSLKDAPREGEIAISNTATENRPRRASVDLQGQSVPDKSTLARSQEVKASKSSKKNTASKTAPKVAQNQTTKVENKSATATAIGPKEIEASRPPSPAPIKKTYEHLLLPKLNETLKLPEDPSLLQRLARLFYSTGDSDLKHLNLVKDPPRIKNALVIGVHGYFPAPLIQSVLGRPTGTSIKFAEMAAKSIRRYTKAKGYDCSIKTAALEGEGKITDRLDLLWKLLLNWIEEIRKADFVMVACHSQGVPVAIMLVAKLIHFGCISSARVGVCAMAGVSMGPFPEFKSRWISGSAGELFEFADPTSKVSTDYMAALDDVLRFGVRLTYVGSIDDQLVSMESSIFAPVSHPHIFRAVSIDSRLQAPSFISHLVAFALKLRNLGVQDHGLIRELSAPLAGSLYTGEGHSRLYEDDAIYDLALSFALETTSMSGVPLVRRNVDPAGGNPYILPFAMRGILEEDFVKSDLQHEASQLLQQFDDWRPQTKALKDVKFRLEGIRSKL